MEEIYNKIKPGDPITSYVETGHSYTFRIMIDQDKIEKEDIKRFIIKENKIIDKENDCVFGIVEVLNNLCNASRFKYNGDVILDNKSNKKYLTFDIEELCNLLNELNDKTK
jgi:hypothetical protein